MKIKQRLILLSLLEFGVWGAYLTTMGAFLAKNGMASNIGLFYSVQGFVSLCMPALMGIVADRWIQAQKLLSICHLFTGIFMAGLCIYALNAESALAFTPLFTLYVCAIAFFMPTIALANSVAYTSLEKAGLDTVKSFPAIR
ncbi:MAG: MFS transporter, partial [Bacteroidaceae bacterium]|nr:MFS transporter [Bacteroidaceae bacterium]MBR4857023.1 MFS transporter [Bacteroidaceae bacterium]